MVLQRDPCGKQHRNQVKARPVVAAAGPNAGCPPFAQMCRPRVERGLPLVCGGLFSACFQRFRHSENDSFAVTRPLWPACGRAPCKGPCTNQPMHIDQRSMLGSTAQHSKYPLVTTPANHLQRYVTARLHSAQSHRRPRQPAHENELCPSKPGCDRRAAVATDSQHLSFNHSPRETKTVEGCYI